VDSICATAEASHAAVGAWYALEVREAAAVAREAAAVARKAAAMPAAKAPESTPAAEARADPPEARAEAAKAPESTPAAEAAKVTTDAAKVAEAAAATRAAKAPESTPAAEAAKVTTTTAKVAKAAAATESTETECRFRSAQAQSKAEHHGTQEHINAFQQSFRSWRQNNCAGNFLKRALTQNSALNAARHLGTQPRHCSVSFVSRGLRFKGSLTGRHLSAYSRQARMPGSASLRSAAKIRPWLAACRRSPSPRNAPRVRQI
jgi:hypothetical protein